MSAKKQMPGEEEFEARDFVYCGLRYQSSNKALMVAIRKIMDDGALGVEMIYQYKRNRDRSIGGVYRGASFSPSHIRGLDANLVFVKRWDDQADRIRWQAEHDDAEKMHRMTKLEKEAGKIRDIEDIMKPLRAIYQGYRKRNDFAGMDALDAAVQRALRTPLRSTEANE